MITAKELAKKLGLSEAAVSIALNGKPGVSEQTRDIVLQAAKKYGYNFSRIKEHFIDLKEDKGIICLIVFKKHGAILTDTPFFSQLEQGIETGCKNSGYRLSVQYVFESEHPEEEFALLSTEKIKGVILLGTEMEKGSLKLLSLLRCPFVLLDTYFEGTDYDSVLINNVQGAYIATSYLQNKYKSQPGYLHSSYPINNFTERADGFYKALRENGLSPSRSIVHRLAPSSEGAYADMKDLLEKGEPMARCFFADNDLIAAGAMRAFTECGIKIPQEVAIIGFDDMPICTMTTPPLTTVHVPKQAIGKLAAKRLLEKIADSTCPAVKFEVSTTLIRRGSA